MKVRLFTLCTDSCDEESEVESASFLDFRFGGGLTKNPYSFPEAEVVVDESSVELLVVLVLGVCALLLDRVGRFMPEVLADGSLLACLS